LAGAQAHPGSPLYDVSSHRAGRGRLAPIVAAEIGGGF
jgi:hypothetical protein